MVRYGVYAFLFDRLCMVLALISHSLHNNGLAFLIKNQSEKRLACLLQIRETAGRWWRQPLTTHTCTATHNLPPTRTDRQHWQRCQTSVLYSIDLHSGASSLALAMATVLTSGNRLFPSPIVPWKKKHNFQMLGSRASHWRYPLDSLRNLTQRQLNHSGKFPHIW